MNMVMSKHAPPFTVTCSACGQEWKDAHRCPVSPTVEFGRYTTGALKRLAADLALVLEGREREPA